MQNSISSNDPKAASASPVYASFIYTSDEAKRLLRLILDDNHQLLETEPKDSEAYKFLKALEIVEQGGAETKDSSSLTFDERGNILSDVTLAKSFAITKPPARSGTIMHMFNSSTMHRNTANLEEQRNVDYLSDVSHIAHQRTKFVNLEALLDKVCPEWSANLSRLPQHTYSPQEDLKLARE